jgi:hypothetical protein
MKAIDDATTAAAAAGLIAANTLLISPNTLCMLTLPRCEGIIHAFDTL